MDKDELIEKLLRIDEDAYFANASPERRRASVVIVGGSALLLCDLSSKLTTRDVDTLQMNADNAARQALLSDPAFNMSANAFCENIPFNFEDRLVRVELETMAIDYYVPSQEDLAVMKLYRWSPVDEADLTAPAFLERLDWDLLDRLVLDPEEAQASHVLASESKSYKEMRQRYLGYREEWKR